MKVSPERRLRVNNGLANLLISDFAKMIVSDKVERIGKHYEM